MTDNREVIAGMYEIDNPEYHKVKVGKYTICRQGSDSIWVQNDQDEGSEFPDELFEKALDEFWKDHF